VEEILVPGERGSRNARKKSRKRGQSYTFDKGIEGMEEGIRTFMKLCNNN
jgi:hypothetical protein